MKITLELTAEKAAGLKRFTEKVSHDAAMAVLYPHVDRDLRIEQASTIIDAFGLLDTALGEAGARGWPWVETGRT